MPCLCQKRAKSSSSLVRTLLGYRPETIETNVMIMSAVPKQTPLDEFKQCKIVCLGCSTIIPEL